MQLRCAFGIPSFNINHPFPPKTLLNERVLTASKTVLSSPTGAGQIWLFKCKGRESVTIELYWPYFQGFLAMWAEACICPGSSIRRRAGLRLLPWPSVPPPLRIFTHLGKKACLYMDGPLILWTFCLVFVHRFRNPQAKKGGLCFLCCTGSLDILRMGCRYCK